MKKSFLPWIIIAVIYVGLYSWVKGINNTAVELNQNIEQSWEMFKQLIKDMYLIGNLVNTVKVLLNLKSTLTAVIEARAKATQVTIDPTNILQIN
jgi:LemA protein